MQSGARSGYVTDDKSIRYARGRPPKPKIDFGWILLGLACLIFVGLAYLAEPHGGDWVRGVYMSAATLAVNVLGFWCFVRACWRARRIQERDLTPSEGLQLFVSAAIVFLFCCGGGPASPELVIDRFWDAVARR